MPEIEYDPADTVAAGAFGAPGRRAFFIQATKDGEVLNVLVEKQQVALLAERLDTLLDQVATQFPAAELQSAGNELLVDPEPVPLFRAVAIGIGFDAVRQMVVLELHERPVPDGDDLEEAADDPDDESLAEAIAAVAGVLDAPMDEPEGYLARLFLTAGEARALAVRGRAAVQAGRPPCELCGFPLDPDGHTCPKLNGHGRH